MSKKPLLGLAALAFLLFLIGGGVVYAKASASLNYPPIVQKIAERFSLQPDEVNKVFTETREQRLKEREALLRKRLEEAVKAGKITSAQKDAFLKKRAEIQQKMEEVRNNNLTPREKREKLSQLREEMRTWSLKNGFGFSFCCRGAYGPRLNWNGGQDKRPGFGRFGAGGSCGCPSSP